MKFVIPVKLNRAIGFPLGDECEGSNSGQLRGTPSAERDYEHRWLQHFGKHRIVSM